MKILSSTLALCVLTAINLSAGPLVKKHVPADAKWLLHLDLDNFRQTKIGSFISKEMVEKKLEQEFNKHISQLKGNPRIDFKKIRSLTAYGVDYESEHNGVLLVQAGQNIKAILDGLVSDGSDKESGNPGLPLKKLEHSSLTFYSLKDDLFASVSSNDVLLLGKSKDQIEKALQVLAGKSANLTSHDTFAGFSAMPNSFFFMGIAESFNAKSAIPPQAKVLQMAEGGRLVLGENADKLFLELALRAKNPEVSTQIQQIVQGTVALVSLSQDGNEELSRLAQSIKVSSKDNLVTVNLEYPVAKAIEKLSEEMPNLKVKVTPATDGEKKAAPKESDK